jgi:hypothetical protein
MKGRMWSTERKRNAEASQRNAKTKGKAQWGRFSAF